jgi:hypothetical protein
MHQRSANTPIAGQVDHSMSESTKQPKLCFVIGPIGKAGGEDRRHSDWLFQTIIQPVFQEHFRDTRVERSDKISVPGMIDQQIIDMLFDCDLVIADMSRLNANAFYEIGIRHMIRKPVIHMFLEGEAIPFDVAPYRAIPFSLDHPDHLEAARVALKAAVEIVRSGGYVVENPVTRAQGQLHLLQEATIETRAIMDELRELKQRLEAMEVIDDVFTLRINTVQGMREAVASNILAFAKKCGLTIRFGRSKTARWLVVTVVNASEIDKQGFLKFVQGLAEVINIRRADE